MLNKELVQSFLIYSVVIFFGMFLMGVAVVISIHTEYPKLVFGGILISLLVIFSAIGAYITRNIDSVIHWLER